MDIYDLSLILTEPLLGTVPMDKDVYTNFIMRKQEMEDIEDELETLNVDEQIERGTTGFHRLDGKPIIYDYVIKGFCKDACGMLRRVAKSGSSKIRAYKKVIDGLLFVEPRRIPIEMLDGGEMSILERPLRAQTAQGERIALARSESVPAGSKLSLRLLILGGIAESTLREWLSYGALRGLGQWRNSGMGRFEYELNIRSEHPHSKDVPHSPREYPKGQGNAQYPKGIPEGGRGVLGEVMDERSQQ